MLSRIKEIFMWCFILRRGGRDDTCTGSFRRSPDKIGGRMSCAKTRRKAHVESIDLKAAERDAARGWCIRDAVVSGRNVDKNAPTSPPPLLR